MNKYIVIHRNGHSDPMALVTSYQELPEGVLESATQELESIADQAEIMIDFSNPAEYLEITKITHTFKVRL